MPLDTALARTLVAELGALHAATPLLRPDAAIVYEHDDLVDASDVETEVRIAPDTFTHERQARNVWSSNATLLVTIEGRQQDNTTAEKPNTQKDIDDWLDFVDEITNHVKELRPNGKKAVSIDSEDRYDKELLKTQRLFFSSFTVSYSLI